MNIDKKYMPSILSEFNPLSWHQAEETPDEGKRVFIILALTNEETLDYSLFSDTQRFDTQELLLINYKHEWKAYKTQAESEGAVILAWQYEQEVFGAFIHVF